VADLQSGGGDVRRLVLILLGVATGLGWITQPWPIETVAAGTVKECTIDPTTFIQTCKIVLLPVPSVEVDFGSGSRTGTPLPLRWSRTPTNCSAGLGCPLPCERVIGATTEVGVVYVVMLLNYETNTIVSLRSVCVFPGDPLPQPPPPPPSLPEFADAAAALLRIEPMLNPRPSIGGLTGLDTWLWCVDPGLVSADVSLRGWTAQSSMEAVAFNWAIAGVEDATRSRSVRRDGRTACGAAPVAGSNGGGAAATWMPETKGAYTITLSATWAGTWTLSWNGIPMGTFVLGPVDVPGVPQPYAVTEYVGVLLDPRAG
jgi:hypothetical protein